MVNKSFTSAPRASDADGIAQVRRGDFGGAVMRGIATAAAMLFALTQAQAGIVVTVDKSAQRLTVAVDGSTRYEWPVSTARIGYRTPNGSYRPERLERKWFSRKYDWSPMPYSIFFDGGYAIHGSYEISRLGRPASHGCIRLHPAHAALLYGLVKQRIGETRIVVIGEGHTPEIAERGEVRRAHRSFEEIFVPGEGHRRWER
jgi:lipoprotein-anchoring transpeptidase ErfK/SrfK